MQETAFMKHERESKLDSSAGGAGRPTPLSSRRDNSSRGAGQAADDGSPKDYKKMYEQALQTNEKLKSRLEDSKKELARIQARLERVNQKQGKVSERSNVMDKDKGEKHILEKKISEMEDELKVRTELKNENQRLKDENGALIRVISKLSK
ncbi:protein phosphatase 1 regulatory subunit 12B-like isoform X3 [Alosa alosa]|uniref:protein phosphatase 1 regulatory subunit 12B-like isoform X4 n=1 Tax=Alosa sapidissima TaxID=34773 RepID=UPI001C0A2423|nr:protein phosphatase 1 regulatory subunit 12B-like isoform X4 [Alosa sapidissima]XP_048109917.1 protein phosphatase 1 regulatory subunit 12B-like isoform X3 [Alosa alosa]